MELKDVVFKLIGNTIPIGETNADNERFENLKTMCELVEVLMYRIDYIANEYKSAPEYSVKRAGEYADNFIRELVN